MSTQEHAPVVPVEQTGAAAPAPHGPPEHPVVAHLRFCLARAEERADEIAGHGGREREIAAQHLAKAAQCDEDAMRARADVKTWEVLLERAIAEVGKPATPPARQEADPPGRLVAEQNGQPPHGGRLSGLPILHCNGCGRPLRAATPDEQAAAQAGRPPDVRRECPTCLLNIATPEQAS